jgi:hypothetical protein
MNARYFFDCCRELVCLEWKVQTNREGYIFVYNWTHRLVERSVPCLHPVVAVANRVTGYPVLGQEDVDVVVSTQVLALPPDFGGILNQAVRRRDSLQPTVHEVRMRLLESLMAPPKLYEPEPNTIRAHLIG